MSRQIEFQTQGVPRHASEPKTLARREAAVVDTIIEQRAQFRRTLLRRTLGLTLAVLAAVLIHAVARSGWYTPGSDIGYNLGLVGALMMLALFGYPLRKRIRGLAHAGRVSSWFSLHMFLGIAGPVLILLHCTLQWRSLNAAIAFWTMVIVAGSGLLGRYLYRGLHYGLYGRQLSLSEVRAETATRVTAAMRQLREEGAGDAMDVVDRFMRRCAVVEAAGWSRPWSVLSLGARAYWAGTRLESAARSPRAGQPFVSQQAYTMADECVRALLRSARFVPYERMFSLWHLLHVPLVLLLVLSVIAHIVAVHMY